jgi:hypothetical protein
MNTRKLISKNAMKKDVLGSREFSITGDGAVHVS